MKKMKNYLMSSLAIVGAVSLIIMACSADNSNNQNSTASTNAVGKYQITSGNASGYQFYVIDTETGIVKSYSRSVAGNITSSHVLTETITTR
jgi:hypothetical protein